MTAGYPLDRYLPSAGEWPSGEGAGLLGWRQGHLLAGVPLTWVCAPGIDPVTGCDSGDDELADTVAVSVPSDASGSIVLSQTCDIATSGPGKRHPFVQVSPVYLRNRSELGSQYDELRQWRVMDKVLLSPPENVLAELDSSASPKELAAIADLRVSVPMSKALLLKAAPLESFAHENDRRRFAEHLAAKLHRPALHDVVSVFVKALDNAIKNGPKDAGHWGDVDMVRICCLPSREAVDSIQLLLVYKGVIVPPEVRNRWNDEVKKIKKIEAVKVHRIKVAPPRHQLASQLLATDYLASDKVDLRSLS